MSRLEDAARYLIGPMMHDVTVPLGLDDQRTIASWAVKTAMVFQCTEATREMWFYSEAECRQLSASLSLPRDTHIWLGRHTRSDTLFAQSRHLSTEVIWAELEPNPTLREGNAYVVTLVLGHVAIQVFTRHHRREHDEVGERVSVRLGPWSDSLMQIWPTMAAFEWPPALSFDEAGIGRLSNRFSPP